MDPLHLAAIVRHIRRAAGVAKVDIGIVCGSGLADLASVITDAVALPYASIPHFPSASVAGHGTELVLGTLGGHRVIAARGRFHFYEGHSPATTGLLPRVFAALGARVLVVTNAAGGVNPAFAVGDIMLIDDHISLPGMAGQHPLVGPNDSRFGPRFPAVTNAYDAACAEAVVAAAEDLGYVRTAVVGVGRVARRRRRGVACAGTRPPRVSARRSSRQRHATHRAHAPLRPVASLACCGAACTSWSAAHRTRRATRSA